MRRARIRVALVMLLITGVLTGLWWDTLVDQTARQRAFDRIKPGMTIPQVERVMRWSGGLHIEQTAKYGRSPIYRWEDAYSTVAVTFSWPVFQDEPVVIDKSLERKDPLDLGRLLRRRFILFTLWLLGLALLVRGMLTPKPADALNSPPTSDTKDGADSPTD